MNLTELNKQYQRLMGEKEALLKHRKQKLVEHKTACNNFEDYTKARWVLTEVAKLTQERFKAKVETLVTMAVQSVFDRAFEFKLNFTRERNKFVCQPVILEGDSEYIPKDDMGGSIIDIISFAFRVVLWSLERPRSRNLFVLDEPMKFVGKDVELIKAGRVIREISHRLGFQVIMVTHEPELASIADKAWTVVHKGGRSHVKEFRFEMRKPKKKLLKRKKLIKRRK